MKRISVILLMFCFSLGLMSQTPTDKGQPNNLIQFSGVVLDQDSLTPIPLVYIIVKGTKRGTNSDFSGFFSLVVSPGDELEFHSMVYKNRSYKIADTLKQKYYYAVQVLTKDTIDLPPIEVFPWPSKEDFKRAFLALNLKDTDLDRAEKNLKQDALTYLERNQSASASENYKYVMMAYYTKAYTKGQTPSISLLNPLAWAQFIDAIKKGKYSNKKKKN
ncbi:MAG: carboxypeptidase-like regulatory domain-containing protein [Bacteroidetes bacterium]|nr:carboxypeptidase-like regulatory domain-containing protein [Bacteroidota bacterium]